MDGRGAACVPAIFCLCLNTVQPFTTLPRCACNNSEVMRTVYSAAHLWDGKRLQENGIIVVEDGRIAEMGTRTAREVPHGANIRDFPNGVLAPAFFDVHIHGAAGHDIMEATPEALSRMGRFLAARGTGAYLATTVSAPVDTTVKSLEGMAKIIAQNPVEGEAKPVGIHLEGPFLSHGKRGAHPPNRLLAPDIGIFDRLFEAAEGNVRLMTLAPELPGAAELAAHATSRGVRISLGHSDANAAETRRAIAAGASSATHTYNAMRALDHKNPGILETVLTTDELYAELICDGIHNMPELVQLWWRAKGPEKAILVTDAMSATGMPDGEYQLGDFPVKVANGRAMIGDALAGSVLTLDKALANFVCFTGASVEQALRLLTVNPAAMSGFGDRGTLKVGGAADFVAVDARGNLLTSVVGGITA
jgi:N-acetylglucosamine-6-phosphate deacetylase